MAREADEAWLMARFSSQWMLTEATLDLIPLQMIPNQVHEIELQLGTLWR